MHGNQAAPTATMKRPGVHTVVTALVTLILLVLGLASLQAIHRIEQSVHQNHLELVSTHKAINGLLHEHGTKQGQMVDNLDALKAEQVNVASRIPVAITSDILPTLDRIEAALTAAKPSVEFNQLDRAHLNRLVVSLHKISDRLNHVEVEVSETLHEVANGINSPNQKEDDSLTSNHQAANTRTPQSPLFARLNNAQKPVPANN